MTDIPRRETQRPVSMMPRKVSDFAKAPWLDLRLDEYPAAQRVPTMLGPAERMFYIWVTQEWARGTGAVVDLGAFVGGSTSRLAAGAAAAGKALDIHAYDQFTAQEVTKRRQLYANGVPQFEGEDILPIARRFLEPWQDLVTLHPGKIEEVGWSGGPIEILVVDVFKRVSLMDSIAGAFFPSLIPGQSLLIQQDFLHWAQPWVSAHMARLGEVFEPVAFAEPDSMVYLLRAPVTLEMLEKASMAEITDAEMLDALTAIRRRLSGWGLRDRLDEMAAGVRANPGVRVPWKMKRP